MIGQSGSPLRQVVSVAGLNSNSAVAFPLSSPPNGNLIPMLANVVVSFSLSGASAFGPTIGTAVVVGGPGVAGRSKAGVRVEDGSGSGVAKATAVGCGGTGEPARWFAPMMIPEAPSSRSAPSNKSPVARR